MTFDGPVEEYLHEAAMMGHNGPPPIVKLTDSIILALMRAVMRRRDLNYLDKAVRWATLLNADEDGVSMTSVKKLSEDVGYTKQVNVRKARDKMVGDGFQEVIGPRSVRGLQVSLVEEITTYCDEQRHSTNGTRSHSTDGTRLRSTDGTRSGLPGSDGTRLRGSHGTTSSRTRVSYTGNIKNIPLPRDHAREDWRSFVLVDGNLEITDVGRRYWMDRGMDEARIELEIIQADGKLTDYDRKTPDGVEKKAGLFFARSLQETIDKDKRYEAAVSRKETEKPKKISRSAQEALEKRKKLMEERGEQ
jgi:hypothetical protein